MDIFLSCLVARYSYNCIVMELFITLHTCDVFPSDRPAPAHLSYYN